MRSISNFFLIALGAMFLQQTFASVGKVLPASTPRHLLTGEAMTRPDTVSLAVVSAIT